MMRAPIPLPLDQSKPEQIQGLSGPVQSGPVHYLSHPHSYFNFNIKFLLNSFNFKVIMFFPTTNPRYQNFKLEVMIRIQIPNHSCMCLYA